MAGDWIKLEHATIDKPEIYKMADILELDPNHILGSVLSVWIWADQQLESGNAANVTKTLLDRKANVTNFTDAMVSVGWLNKTDEGYEFPNFDRHLGNSAKKRAQTARRVAKSKIKTNAYSVTKELPSALPREEKRREEGKENNKKKSSAITNFYKEWTDPEFWELLLEVNKDKKYEHSMIEKFYTYWAEKNDKGKMRFQMEKTWSINGRLANWHSRQNN
ncbi:MAG: hypothetical protein DRH97_00015 [Chloroflexi bacterium]|nr:MAG: hypothetical protein DRH97_00015 [Chloroflexota bacterium]